MGEYVERLIFFDIETGGVEPDDPLPDGHPNRGTGQDLRVSVRRYPGGMRIGEVVQGYGGRT